MPYNFQNTFEKPAYTIDSAKTDLNFGNAIKNIKDIYAFKQEKNLNDAWANNYDPSNQKLDANGFIAQANKAGIGPSAANAWLANKTAISETTLKTAKNDSALTGMGKDPSIDYNAMGKGYSVEGAGAPVSPTTIDADKLPDPNAPGYGASRTQIPAPTVAPTTPSDKTAPSNVAVAPNVPKTPAQLMADRQSATATGNADGSVTGTVNITGGNPEARGGEEAKMVNPGNYIEPDRRDMVDKIRGSEVAPANAGNENPTGLWDAKSAYGNTAKNIQANAAIDFVTAQFATPKVKKDANGKEVATTREERAQFAHDNFIKQAVAGVATTDNDYMPLPPNVVAAKRAEAIQKAEADWDKKIADAVSSDISGQGAKQAATTFSNAQTDRKRNQELLNDARARGYAIGPEQLPKFLDVEGKVKNIEEARTQIHDLLEMKPADLDKLSEDDLVNRVYNATVTYSNAENVSSVAAAEKAETGLRIDKSLQQSISEHGLGKELIIDRLKNLGAQDKLVYLKNLAYRLDNAHQAETEREKFKGKKTPAELHNDKTGSGAEGTKENPIPYTRGMKTYKGKYYSVGGVIAEGKY